MEKGDADTLAAANTFTTEAIADIEFPEGVDLTGLASEEWVTEQIADFATENFVDEAIGAIEFLLVLLLVKPLRLTQRKGPHGLILFVLSCLLEPLTLGSLVHRWEQGLSKVRLYRLRLLSRYRRV